MELHLNPSPADSTPNATSMGDVALVQFEELFDLEQLQLLQDQFAKATGVASIITKPDGTPITRPSQFCRLCFDIIRKTEKGCANCFRSDAELGKHSPEGPTVQPCMSGGLWDAGAGISVGGQHVANWLIGQVRDESQSPEAIREYALEIGADPDEAARAFEEVTPMSGEQFTAVAEMLFTLANQLSSSAYQNLLLKRQIAANRAAVDALRRNEENLHTTLQSIGDAVIATDPAGRVTRMNRVAEDLTGWAEEEARGRPLDDVFHLVRRESRKRVESPVRAALEKDEIVSMEFPALLLAHDEREHLVSDSAAPIRSAAGEVLGVVMVFRDITREDTLQAQLQQSMKMDAIGQLAGGVAHDFNNMLGGIIGATEMLGKYLVDDPKARRFQNMVLTTADRAAELTSNLLAFSRRQAPGSSSIHLHATIQDTITLLERTVDKRVRIQTGLTADTDVVVGDPTQLQSALLNLALNAAQAMPEGGELTFTTRNILLSSQECEASEFALAPGPFVELAVSDTGCGISPDALQHIFEPFFTTKEVGKGTGLGLAAVYGTIQQHNGAISVYSEVGQGTVFHIKLPVSPPSDYRPAKVMQSLAGTGRVLVVDDEAVMRATAAAILEELGYTVTIAGGSHEALALFSADPQAFDLVILDMIMPDLNGRQCFSAMRKIRPDIAVVLASGFTREEDVDGMKEEGLKGFLRKPFRSAELSHAVHLALHG